MRNGVVNMAVFLQMKDVVKRYGNKLSVDHMNLEVNEGKSLGFWDRTGPAKARPSV